MFMCRFLALLSFLSVNTCTDNAATAFILPPPQSGGRRQQQQQQQQQQQRRALDHLHLPNNIIVSNILHEHGGLLLNEESVRVRVRLQMNSKPGDSDDVVDTTSLLDDTNTTTTAATVTTTTGGGTNNNKETVEEEEEARKKAEAMETKRNVSFGAFKLFSYVIQFLGLYFSFGLLLNILGYGYSFDFENGFRVDKMENLRNEMQFRREIERSSSSSSSMLRSSSPTVSEVLDDNTSPSSSLPR